MEHAETSHAAAILLDYLDRKGPKSDEDRDICRQLIPLVVREAGAPSAADLATRPARRRDVEEALLRLEERGGSAGWLLDRLAGAGHAPSSDHGFAVGGIRQQNQGDGNLNQVIAGSPSGLNINFAPQVRSGLPSEGLNRPDWDSRDHEHMAPIRDSRDREGAAPVRKKELSARESTVLPLQADLEIRVLEGFLEGRSTLTFEVTAKDPYWRLDRKSFGPVVLRKDPEAFLRPHLANLGKMTGGDESEGAIRSLGSDLCRQLLEPCGLLSLLWGLQHRITTLLLISDEPWIPWELVRLEDPAGGGSATGRYLCEAFALARWLTGSEPTLDLPMRRMALVASEAGWAAGLKEEKEFLEKQQSVARSVDSVPAHLGPLLLALAGGGYDSWHFCGHGGQSISDANQAYLVLDDDRVLTPSVVRTEAAGLGRSHPFVFLNGCHTGRGGLGLTSLGGWATQLLASGAGAFLGSLWAINGYRAAEFTQAFYPRLFAGVPIAQAVRDARQANRSAGDPSWLAYSLYAHPLASCAGLSG